MSKPSLLFMVMFLAGNLFAQKQPLTYFLPNIQYDDAIPSPEEYLGYQVGEWHVGHDQLVAYMREVARLSDRVTIEEYARSYEHRPLVLLTITSPENHQNIEKIREDHLALTDPKRSNKMKTEDMPSIVYEGFSVHGNEASGGNAALLVAYYLAAGQDASVTDLLRNEVVLLDPCFNPDGFNRFASWVNTHKGKNLVADAASRELNEAWPGGRTNHYWFDLNRDWLLVQHPESQGRIRNFHRWRPNILTDHHEMGSNSTFFFQPGIPSRANPITPARNQELTREVAEFHAKALDKIGSLYYSEESFDDFYYGKGSTYPDANGCIGILFEQASARGHLHESTHGDLSFPFAVRNQVTTALSTLEAGKGLRKELLDFQREFYQTAMQEAAREPQAGYVFGESHDRSRLQHFLELLQQHQIEIYDLKQDLRKGQQQFTKNQAFYVPLAQPQYRLVKAIFEKTTSFRDSLFYDVSAWTLPLSFNLEYTAVNKGQISGKKGSRFDKLSAPVSVKASPSSYAYLFTWDDYYAPKALNTLLQNKLIAKVSNRDFTLTTASGDRDLKRGTIIVPLENQTMPAAEVEALVLKTLNTHQIEAIGASSGFTSKGIDLGSPSFSKVEQPKVLLLVGRGVSSYDAGEVWHLLDQRMDIPLTLVESANFGSVDLNDYNTLLMVNGNYSRLKNVDEIKDWVKDGGKIVAMRSAINWANANGLANVKTKANKGKDRDKTRRPYDRASPDRGANVIGGAIFEVALDLTHPLAYGIHRSKIPVFRRGTAFVEPTENRYATPGVYTDQPLLSGYISDKNYQTLRNSAAITVSRLGGGRVICLVDNPNFRAFWYGTNKLFLNAVFFGGMIDGRTAERPAPKKSTDE